MDPYAHIRNEDEDIYHALVGEEKRQAEGLELIPSENYASAAVMEAMGSILTNKYSEGYAGKRYYNGNEFIDQVETFAIERAKSLFGVAHANVQPYSGSPANLAVYLATANPGDTIMGLNLPDGGHLTHGWKISATAIFYNSVPYHVREDGRIDMDEVWALAKEHAPKLIWAGATAYPFLYEYEKFAEIADSVGAYFAADIAHVAGLIAAGAHPSPVPHAHIVTTTTHKTLRGPRGGIIMTTERGLAKDPDLAAKLDKAVFPGLQGGPHDHQTAAIAIALKEATTEEFKAYGHQVVANAKALAEGLKKHGLTLVSGGTENHLLLMDLAPILGPGGGVFVSDAMEAAGMTANKNTVPKDPASPFYPSGVRLGTPALTTRGMKEKEMGKVAEWIARVVEAVGDRRLPTDMKERTAYLKEFNESLKSNKELGVIRDEIREFTKDYPIPA
ncbi:MAG: glycine hydroxymethyltransferase [Candidatus Parcubacteria bacterium]|jgi:glycine hydroxymethyltransferase|nr:glycine hydroxymethyltransferase [Candidatus Parcubacteria bacterium]